LKTLANLQAGGAGFAVDEDLGHDAGCLVSSGSEMRQYNYALCERDHTPLVRRSMIHSPVAVSSACVPAASFSAG
ncbi:MAG: hypothetical protein Q7U09_08575, partial [Hydrogenophaga sp.]|nr:hypothetical protein [Hydrogenophaga sp.]